jgi:hypothetical protein
MNKDDIINYFFKVNSMLINSINKFIQQSFLTIPLKIVSSAGWVALAILTSPSFLIGREYSCFFARKAVAIWNKNESSTTTKVNQVASSINLDKNSFEEILDQSEIASDAGDENISKTENEIVNILRNEDDDLISEMLLISSSVDQFTEDVHEMGQDFGHMTEAVSQASAEISTAINKASQDLSYMAYVTSKSMASISQDFHQASLYARVTCFSLTTSALTALAVSMTDLQNSSCNRDPESILCVAPLKSIALATIVTGFVAINMLMPNRARVHQNRL